MLVCWIVMMRRFVDTSQASYCNRTDEELGLVMKEGRQVIIDPFSRLRAQGRAGREDFPLGEAVGGSLRPVPAGPLI
jgi:hypothetical protein